MMGILFQTMRVASSILIFLFVGAALGMAQSQSVSLSNTNDGSIRAEIRSLEELAPRLPDRAPALSQLAHDYASLGDFARGMTLLKQCISLREGFTAEGDPAFEKLKNNPEFKSLIDEVHGEFPSVHHAKLAFTIPRPDLVPEGIGIDPKRQVFYVSSLNHKEILKMSEAGVISEFVPEGKYDLRPVCGIKVDSTTHDVWAVTCPEDGIGSELIHFDSKGNLLGRFQQSTTGPHMFNDLVLVDGLEIYLTDSLANQVLRFDRRSNTFLAVSFPRPLYYPNGIAISENRHLLYVADAFGVLEYDLQKQKGREVGREIRTTISGFDGLYWYRGTLVGIQNSLGLPRVVQSQLSSDGSRVTRMNVLEYRTEFAQMPTTGAIEGSSFYFMTNTQVDNWKDGKIVDPRKLTPVRVAVISLK
jgi:hypothetical protein